MSGNRDPYKQIVRFLDDLSPSELKLKDLPRKAEGIYNGHFNEYGQIEKRKGYSKYNTTSLGAAHKITGMHRYHKRLTTTKEFLAAWNNKWYTIAATTPWAGTTLKSKAATDFTTTADMDTHWVNFGDECYGVNSKGLWKYDGTYVETVGITPPIAPTSPPTNVNGALSSGNYKYRITYVDTDGYESNGGTVSANIVAGANPNDGITLTIPVSSDSKIASRNIYRTVVGGLGAYYYEGAVADNTTTTFNSIVADSVIILNEELESDHTVPPTTPHLICTRRSRLMLADENNTIASALKHEYFPPSLVFPSGNGQKVTGLKEQLHTLPVFTDDSLERLTNFDASNYEFKNAFSNEGCIASRSLCNCKNMLVYLGYDGIYYFNGTVGRKLDYKLSKYVADNINAAYAHLSCGVYYKDKYILTYPKGASTVPNESVYYDFETHTTGFYNLGFSCYSVWDKGGDTYSLKGGSNTIGQIYSVFDGLDDDGSAITFYDDIEPIDLGLPDTYKIWYDIYIKVKTTTGTAMRMYYNLDDHAETFVSETLTASKTAWYKIGLGGVRARALGYRAYISDKYDATIMGYCLTYSLEPAKWRK